MHGYTTGITLAGTGSRPYLLIIDVALQHPRVSRRRGAGPVIQVQGLDGVFGPYVSQT